MELKCHTLNHWKTRRSMLTSAIREYLVACADLRAICTQTQYISQARQEVEEALQAVNVELEGLKSEEEELRKARDSLAATRNCSRILSPAHGLPPELLAQIFVQMGHRDFCEDDTAKPPYAHPLAGVSSYWRRIAIETPTLWTQIALTTRSRHYNYSNLQLQRSKGLTVTIFIFHQTNDPRVTMRCASLWSSFLKTARNRIHTLEITSHCRASIKPIYSMMKHWLKIGYLGTTTRLRLSAMSDKHELEQDLELQSNSEHSESLLHALTTLHLTRVAIPWDSCAYHGLVDLRLCFESDIDITDYEFAGILAASPHIVTLQLYGLNAEPSEDWDGIPICPAYLETFCLGTTSVISASTLLSAISLSDCLNNLSIGLQLYDLFRLADKLEDFLRDTKTVTLSCSELYSREGDLRGPTSDFQRILSLSKVIPSLQNLVLHASDEWNWDAGWDDPDLPAVKPQVHADEIAPTNVFPRRIPHLFIPNFPARLDVLRSIVSAHSIQTLHLDPREFFGRNRDSDISELQKMKVALMEEFLDLECIVSDGYETYSWPCRVDVLWYQQV
ncbi:hypothetical protein FRC09_001253 [Ceratobasidium sp. 395]|nr:hypothetical protein FRC09_001253 [Ceratobasidium sp. 395]